MMDGTRLEAIVDRGLGRLGLLLLVLTEGAAKRLDGPSRTRATAAHLVLVGIAIVGWAADRLPTPDEGTELLGTAAEGTPLHPIQPSRCGSR